MKRSILATAFVAATFWIANTPAFAQHGRPASPGAVAPSMHGGASSGASHASSRPTTSPSSPDAVLSRNSHLSGALSSSANLLGGRSDSRELSRDGATGAVAMRG